MVPVVDLWQKVEQGTEGPAHGLNSTCHGMQGNGPHPAACVPGPNDDHWYSGYEDSLFEQHVLSTIETHDPAQPLFVFWAPHIVHTPLQVPQSFLDKFAFIEKTDKAGHQRQYYHAMVNFADEALANITAAYKRKGMYDDLLIVFSTDNGGPVYGSGSAGANNYPLKVRRRATKSDEEGG
jgi:arylsulfatase I/J